MRPDDSITSDRAPVVSGHAPKVDLSVLKGPGAGQNILLRRAASILGSGKGCKIRFKHGDVSRVHCVIVNTGEDIFVRDLISRNGTFLNSLRAEHERLEDDDLIKVHDWQLRIAIDAGEPGAGDFTGLGLDPAPAVIALQNTPSNGLVKLPREVNLLGRVPGCDVVVEDRSVSKAHAIVFNYLSRPAVFDLLSHNGTKVNGHRVSFATLHADDVLTLGSVDLKVQIVEPLSKVKSSGNGQAVRAPAPDGTFGDRIDIRSSEAEPR